MSLSGIIAMTIKEPASGRDVVSSTTNDNENTQSDDSVLLIDEHVEEISENGKKMLRKGIFLLPNLFTTGALFSGFYAILMSIHGSFEAAAIAIFVAQFLDGLDGRVARLTNTSSAFGVEYDSLADMVSFGLAPAIIAFNWALVSLDKFGWAPAFLFTACAALRLARFNAQSKNTDSHFFTGLASPPAAACIAGAVWFWHDYEVSQSMAILLSVVMVVLSFLMVSNFKYNSFKSFDSKRRVPFIVTLLVIFLFVFISVNIAFTFLCMAIVYSVSGPVFCCVEKICQRQKMSSAG